MSWAPEFAVADSVIVPGLRALGDRTTRAHRGAQAARVAASSRAATPTASGADGVDVFPRLAELDGRRIRPRRASGSPRASQHWTCCSPMATARVGAPSSPGRRGAGRPSWASTSCSTAPERASRASSPSLQEDEQQLERVAAGFGWSFGEDDVSRCCTCRRSTSTSTSGSTTSSTAPRRSGRGACVLDSLTDLSAAVRRSLRFREYLYSLAQRCAKLGISLMLTLELPDLYEPSTTGHEGISHLSDNVILLHYAKRPDGLSRIMTVLKARATELPAGHAGVPHHLRGDPARRPGLQRLGRRCGKRSGAADMPALRGVDTHLPQEASASPSSTGFGPWAGPRRLRLGLRVLLLSQAPSGRSPGPCVR